VGARLAREGAISIAHEYFAILGSALALKRRFTLACIECNYLPRLMRYLLPLCLLCAWNSSAMAFDTTTQGVVMTGYVTSQVTTAPFDRKIVLHARDDAAAFVATDGAVRGVQLESALDYLRTRSAKLHASDLELAQAILVQ
jgi:uncharacterized protein (TIGR02448 family)